MTADGTNPASTVAFGRARIPAPTVVPATKQAEPKSDPGSCFMLTALTLLQSRPPCAFAANASMSSSAVEAAEGDSSDFDALRVEN